jgi:hypothetical protein
MRVSKIDSTYFGPREFISRNSPLTIIFFLAIILMIIGATITAFVVLVWVGLIIALVYFVYFVIWLFVNK